MSIVQFWARPSTTIRSARATRSSARASHRGRAPRTVLARNVALTNARLYENAPFWICACSRGRDHRPRTSRRAVDVPGRAHDGQPPSRDLHDRAVDDRPQPRSAGLPVARGRRRDASAMRSSPRSMTASSRRTTRIYWPPTSSSTRSRLASGRIHVLHDGEKVMHERVFPTELQVDPIEAHHGWPHVRTVGRRRRMDLDAVFAAFGDTDEKEAAIRNAASKDASVTGTQRRSSSTSRGTSRRRVRPTAATRSRSRTTSYSARSGPTPGCRSSRGSGRSRSSGSGAARSPSSAAAARSRST